MSVFPLLAALMVDPAFPIIELRQYTLHAGQRDVLIDLFEKELIESQEAVGMAVLATFRDLDRPDRFVWIRGFRDMPSRAEFLGAFYGGPVWKTQSAAANRTMIDSDNVLLLRAAGDPALVPAARAPRGATEIPKGLVIATIYSLLGPAAGTEFTEFFERVMRPELDAAGFRVRASYVTESSPNNFPRLPVREKETVFVWFSLFEDEKHYELANSRLTQSPAWQKILMTLHPKLKGQPEVLRLQRTARSALPFAMGSPNDFDFLIGDWTVHHRRLKKRLENNREWIEFKGPATARKILNGLGNFDEITINLPEGVYFGATLRLFNPRTESWSIHWMDSRYPGVLDAPMVGRFENGRGLFFGEDTFNGKPIRIRFIWTPLTPTSCRWEQAFSADGGTTWETNWIMSFEKKAR